MVQAVTGTVRWRSARLGAARVAGCWCRGVVVTIRSLDTTRHIVRCEALARACRCGLVGQG
ncbi:hypothetical protein E2562_027455 [Oryza meyeriana var. granulata]|uniref:Uncharacterized protein n=1 Tax=Oryza meyeriana var. granulata TaxID=110450 RepID=A0A6G1CIZ9_9ORYZ|nr:hypothetical protein E2562_027455 [Oryza meyeriana var. granulata]